MLVKCKLFLTGLQHFTIVTDHNPLIPILNNKNAPDALSHHSISDPQPTETLTEIDIHYNPEMSFTELQDTQSESLHL